MAVVSFVVVGVSPRTLGRQNYDTVALWAAPVAVGLRKVLGPVSRVLVALGNAVTPGKGYRDGPFQSEAELRDLLDMAGDTRGHRGGRAGDDPLGLRARRHRRPRGDGARAPTW